MHIMILIAATMCAMLITQALKVNSLSSEKRICSDISTYIERGYKDKNPNYSCEEIEKEYIKENYIDPFIKKVERDYFEKEDNVCNPFKYQKQSFFYIQKEANGTSCEHSEEIYISSKYENPFIENNNFFEKHPAICNPSNYKNEKIAKEVIDKGIKLGSCILGEEEFIKEKRINPYNELNKDKKVFNKYICDPRLYKDEAYSYIYDLALKNKSCEKAEKLFIDRFKVSPFIFDKTTVKEIKIKNAIINNENKTTGTNVQAENAIINNNGGTNNLNVNEK